MYWRRSGASPASQGEGEEGAKVQGGSARSGASNDPREEDGDGSEVGPPVLVCGGAARSWMPPASPATKWKGENTGVLEELQGG